jgi:hypothetical protein
MKARKIETGERDDHPTDDLRDRTRPARTAIE